MAIPHHHDGSSDDPSLVDRAAAILDAATALQQRLAALALPQPTDLPGGRRDWHDASAHPDVLAARSALVDASAALLRLALGPTDYLAALAGPGVAQLEVLRTLDALGVAQAVPLLPQVVDNSNDDDDSGEAAGGDGGGGGEEGDGRGDGGEGAGPAMIALPRLAADLGVDEARLARQLRFAYLVGVFREPRPGFVAHTAASAALPAAAPWLRVRTSAALTRGVERLPEVLRGQSRDQGQGQDEVSSAPSSVEKTATQLADPRGRGLWAILDEDYEPPGEGTRLFAAGMRAMMAGLLGDDLLPYAHGFDWASLCGDGDDDDAAAAATGERRRATVVDVGGGNGHVEVALLPRVPAGVDFVVQDLPANEASARALLAPYHHHHQGGGKGGSTSTSSTSRSRITFQAHDFFQPQPALLDDPALAPPSVYLLSRVLHDWRDDECVAILRHLVPGMERHGARLWLCERVLPGGDGDGLPNHVEQQLRAPDLLMLTLFGGGERTMADWARVLARTDARLRVRACRRPMDSVFSFIEVVLDGAEG